MVGGTLLYSVVAKIKMMWGGGSSIVFSKASNAFVDKSCTSSMM